MRIRLALLAILLLGIGLTASAQDDAGKVELSIGIGDQMFEKLIWHEEASAVGLLPESATIDLDEDYKYSQHWFIKGSYRPNKVVSIGAMLDASYVRWTDRKYNGLGDFLGVNAHEYFVNMVVMPVATFYYMNRKYVSLHTSVGSGFNVNTGSETDFLGRETELAPAYYINPIGIRGTYNRFFASFDLGALFSLSGSNRIYMAGSRLFSLSIGVTL